MIKRSHDRLIFKNGGLIPGKTGLKLKPAPDSYSTAGAVYPAEGSEWRSQPMHDSQIRI